MTKILVKCIQDVVHGPYNLSRGQEAMMHDHLANDLKAFVEPVHISGNSEGDESHKSLGDAPLNKMLSDSGFENKGNQPGFIESEGESGNGQEPSGDSPPYAPQNSSLSPADPALPVTTVKPSANGGKGKKGAR